MGDSEKTPLRQDGKPGQECPRCHAAVALVTVLPAWGQHPAYRIFGCTECTFMEWIAEKISGE
jgi:hypothetical protein